MCLSLVYTQFTLFASVYVSCTFVVVLIIFISNIYVCVANSFWYNVPPSDHISTWSLSPSKSFPSSHLMIVSLKVVEHLLDSKLCPHRFVLTRGRRDLTVQFGVIFLMGCTWINYIPNMHSHFTNNVDTPFNFLCFLFFIYLSKSLS